MKSIQEISKNFNFYVKGDMKKFYRALKSEGYDIVDITHNPNYQGMGVAATEVIYCDSDGGFPVETVVWG